MNVFELRNFITSEYRRFSTGYSTIKAKDIKTFVHNEAAANPLENSQIEKLFEASNNSLMETCWKILRERSPKFLMSFMGIGRVTDERTIIATSYPFSGVGNSLPVFNMRVNVSKSTLLQANLSALVFDFVSRQKVGGINLNFYLFKQLPVLSPDQYTQTDIDYIHPRVLELGYTGEPFGWDEDRRLQLRCELDAYYAYLYGLTRDELRYILDPSDVMGEDFPSVTFPGLKRKELEKYGEFRTQSLVLEAYDRLSEERGIVYAT